ncbi:Integrator complex subunit 11 [Galdieria sulphuraria]|nr:Integrator complex subunit 11 [Galdieria sulphuraria]
MELFTLGACRQVGKSCFVLKTSEGLVMLDCGLHPSYQDDRRYPNFGLAFSYGPLKAVFITHCHADHVGALPILTERWGYDGPIYMSEPTRKLSYYILEECSLRVVVYTTRSRKLLNKVHSWMAGHVLGAYMFSIVVDNHRILYTGDFTSCPTFHLPPARVDDIPYPPDVILSEATYATSFKDGRLNNQVEFIQNVLDCLLDGGKVLVPVFAIGRAQELLLLLEMYWQRFHLSFPILFSTKNAHQVLQIYTEFAHWTHTPSTRDEQMMSYQTWWSRVQVVDPEQLLDAVEEWDRPLVALTTPGTLARGLSLQVFRRIAPDEKNLLIIPHFCISGTIEKRLLEEGCCDENKITNENESIRIRCKTMNLHFGFHADTRDLLLFFSQWKPSCIVLVHGEGEKMDYLARVVQEEWGIQCWVPKEEQWITWKPNLTKSQ